MKYRQRLSHGRGRERQEEFERTAVDSARQASTLQARVPVAGRRGRPSGRGRKRGVAATGESKYGPEGKRERNDGLGCLARRLAARKVDLAASVDFAAARLCVLAPQGQEESAAVKNAGEGSPGRETHSPMPPSFSPASSPRPISFSSSPSSSQPRPSTPPSGS